MEYDVCTANDVDELVDIVAALMGEGWRPQGGCCHSTNGSGVDLEIV